MITCRLLSGMAGRLALITLDVLNGGSARNRDSLWCGASVRFPLGAMRYVGCDEGNGRICACEGTPDSTGVEWASPPSVRHRGRFEVEIEHEDLRGAGLMIGPVDWGVHGGDLLEDVMAVFLAQNFPDVLRRTPSSGDGGVDILIEHHDGWEVLQIKGFNHRLGDAQRRQIADSWETFLDEPRLAGPISAWRLVCPVDLTSGEKDWFDELTANAPFEVSYRGRPFWNAMAAEHPHVVDYYFGGGQARVAQRSKTLMSAFEDPRKPLSPDDAAASLEMLRAQLSKDDPHYRFEFLTSDYSPDPSKLPGCIMARTQSVSGGGFITLMLHAKHRYSTEDSPIAGRFVLQSPSVEANKAFLEAVDGFVVFGRSLELEDGLAEFSFSGPLGTKSGGQIGGIRVGASLVESGAKTFRIGCDGPDGTTLAEVVVTRESLTRGIAGGAEMILEDANAVMSVAIQLRPREGETEIAADLKLSIQSELSGSPALHTVNIAELHNYLHPPNSIVLRGEFGSGSFIAEPLQDDELGLHDLQLEMIRMLVRLQPLTREPILVPANVTEDLFKAVRHEVRMLDGETTTGTWDRLSYELESTAERTTFDTGMTVVLDEERRLRIAEVEVPLGLYRTYFKTTRLDASESDDSIVVLLPGDDNTCEMTRIGEPGAGTTGVRIEDPP